MKTAITISNSLYEKAGKTARFMGIPRNKLYVTALEEYISKHDGKSVTKKMSRKLMIKKLNEVYSKIDQSEFNMDCEAGLESLREITKDDTW